MKTLFILNEPPRDTERRYNGLGLARTLANQPDQKAKQFLLVNAVACAQAGQKAPNGYNNAGDIVTMVATTGGLGPCATCITARDIEDSALVPGALSKTLNDLVALTAEADHVLESGPC